MNFVAGKIASEAESSVSGPRSMFSGSVSKAIDGRKTFSCFMVACLAIVGMTTYANVGAGVTDRNLLGYFPPFRTNFNAWKNDSLGAEYRNVSIALYQGRGFADVFEPNGQPTAWMPPMLCWIQGGLLYLVGGNKVAWVASVVLLKTCILIWLAWIVIREGERIGCVARATLIVIVSMIVEFRFCFQRTHDEWLLIALMLLIFNWGSRLLDSSRKSIGELPIEEASEETDQISISVWESCLWGVLGGVSILSSPAVGLAWGCATLYASARQSTRHVALSFMVATLVFMPWCLRNYAVFDAWIPIKSNLFYELDQAFTQTTDGIVDTDTFKTHPFVANGPQRAEYRKLGEVAFVRASRDRWLAEVIKNPGQFALHIMNRLTAATVYYLPMNPRDSQDTIRWFIHAIWFALPMLWLTLVGFQIATPTPRQQLAVVLFTTFLLPYILVSYYHRYSLPVLPLRMFFLLWLMNCCLRGRPSGET